MAAQPEVEALLQYQTIRAQAVRLHTSLANSAPRSNAIMEEVGAFQSAAGVVGQGNQPTGLYGGATQQALEFFLPPNLHAPRPWPGVGAGTWTPPAWVREVAPSVGTPPPLPQKPSYAWLWGVAAAAVGLTALGVALSRRSTKEVTERDMVYASPWLYAQRRARSGQWQPTRPGVQRGAKLNPHFDPHIIPQLPGELFKPGRLPAAPTSKLLGYEIPWLTSSSAPPQRSQTTSERGHGRVGP